MKRKLIPLALVLPILAACSPQQQQQTADVIAAARQACTSIGPVFLAASLVRDPKVQSIVSYADAVCRPLAAGVVPPTVDSNTATWLGSLAGMIRVLVPA